MAFRVNQLIHIQTLYPPEDYTDHEILVAHAIAKALGATQFVLLEPPKP